MGGVAQAALVGVLSRDWRVRSPYGWCAVELLLPLGFVHELMLRRVTGVATTEARSLAQAAPLGPLRGRLCVGGQRALLGSGLGVMACGLASRVPGDETALNQSAMPSFVVRPPRVLLSRPSS